MIWMKGTTLLCTIDTRIGYSLSPFRKALSSYDNVIYHSFS